MLRGGQVSNGRTDGGFGIPAGVPGWAAAILAAPASHAGEKSVQSIRTASPPSFQQMMTGAPATRARAQARTQARIERPTAEMLL